MAAALWNFRLNRRRDRALLDQEARSVAAAIYGEILFLREQLAELAHIAASFEIVHREFSELRADLYRPSEPVVFPSVVGRLGLLDPKLVLGFTRFYARLEEAKRGLDDLITDYDGPNYGCTVVLRPAVSGIKDVESCLRQIEGMMGYSKAGEVNFGRASDIIWEEDEKIKEHHRERERQRNQRQPTLPEDGQDTV